LAFFDFSLGEVISGPSLEYLAGFGGSLRRKVENFRALITWMALNPGTVTPRDDVGRLADTNLCT